MTQYFLVPKGFQPQRFCALHAWVFSNKQIVKSYDAFFLGMKVTWEKKETKRRLKKQDKRLIDFPLV